MFSGTKPIAQYLDVEVDQLHVGEGGLLSADQMLLVTGDVGFWLRVFLMWYLEVAVKPWSREELECAKELMVNWIRDYFAEGEG